ncbi:hypothetical protein IC235_07555 [Hymenobacter sp. BT664]|uniref:Uncharacterized protein n=1 Tax=Hymenobacter montanus TaxID=2771359 RepID=A0A927BCW9_9BACT|nr:hypothetical protein [Hymenobacter montanus]MBD2767747.1 hypothetical protein [Hymenobacter montanus]
MQWQLGWAQFTPFIVTSLAVLFTDLLRGVRTSLAVGFCFILKANAEQAYFPKPNVDHDHPDTVHLQLSEHVSFLNKASIVNTLERLLHGSHIIDGTKSVDIDHQVLEVIESFRRVAPERDPGAARHSHCSRGRTLSLATPTGRPLCLARPLAS